MRAEAKIRRVETRFSIVCRLIAVTLTMRTMAEGDVLPAATDFTISNMQITDGATDLIGYDLALMIEERTVN